MGFSMYYIQDLVCDKNMEDLSVVTIVLPPVINTNYKSTLKCDVPACASC